MSSMGFGMPSGNTAIPPVCTAPRYCSVSSGRMHDLILLDAPSAAMEEVAFDRRLVGGHILAGQTDPSPGRPGASRPKRKQRPSESCPGPPHPSRLAGDASWRSGCPTAGMPGAGLRRTLIISLHELSQTLKLPVPSRPRMACSRILSRSPRSFSATRPPVSSKPARDKL